MTSTTTATAAETPPPDGVDLLALNDYREWELEVGVITPYHLQRSEGRAEAQWAFWREREEKGLELDTVSFVDTAEQYSAWMHAQVARLRQRVDPTTKRREDLIIVLGEAAQDGVHVPHHTDKKGKYKLPKRLDDLPGSNVECVYWLATEFPEQVSVVSLLITAPLASLECGTMENWYDIRGSILTKVGYQAELMRAIHGLRERHGVGFRTFAADPADALRLDKIHMTLRMVIMGCALDGTVGQVLGLAFNGHSETIALPGQGWRHTPKNGLFSPGFGVEFEEVLVINENGQTGVQRSWLFGDTIEGQNKSPAIWRNDSPFTWKKTDWEELALAKQSTWHHDLRPRLWHVTFCTGMIWPLFYNDNGRPRRDWKMKQTERDGQSHQYPARPFNEGLETRFCAFKKLPILDCPQRRGLLVVEPIERRSLPKGWRDTVTTTLDDTCQRQSAKMVTALCLARYGEQETPICTRLDVRLLEELIYEGKERGLCEQSIKDWMELGHRLSVREEMWLHHRFLANGDEVVRSTEIPSPFPPGSYKEYDRRFEMFIWSSYRIWSSTKLGANATSVRSLLRRWQEYRKFYNIALVEVREKKLTVRDMLKRVHPLCGITVSPTKGGQQSEKLIHMLYTAEWTDECRCHYPGCGLRAEKVEKMRFKKARLGGELGEPSKRVKLVEL